MRKVSQAPGNRTDSMVRAQNDIYMVTADAASNSNKDNTAEGLADGRLTRAQLMRNAANICCFLLRSVAMERLLGREEEECAELHSPVSTEGAGDRRTGAGPAGTAGAEDRRGD